MPKRSGHDRQQFAPRKQKGDALVPLRATHEPMDLDLQKPWTLAQFFTWAENQEGRYEFDGFQPVATTGGTVNHGIILRNLMVALTTRLRGNTCQPLGPDVGMATIGNTIRYPDALVRCAKLAGTDRTVAGVVAVFEIVSPSSGRIDRIVKLREYAAVASIKRYVIIESVTSGALVLHRQTGDHPWTALALTPEDILDLPEIGLQIPVAEFYQNVDFAESQPTNINSN
jgi:Uma2 family endonuclease